MFRCMSPMPHDAFRRRVLREIERRKLPVATLARLAGVKRDVIRDMQRDRTSSTSVENAALIAEALGLSLDEMIHSTPVAVAGRVGAGAEVVLVDGYAKGGGLWHVERPPQLAGRRVVAVEVAGDSMEPAYAPGDLLFYARAVLGVPSECAGRRCIAEDAAGHAWVKLLRRRAGQPPGLWDLHSINTAHPPRYDVALAWAAPVLFHLDAAFARRVEPAGD